MPDNGWGWTSEGGYTFGGAPTPSGPTTTPGVVYDPAKDPVLQAFWEGYNLPAPSQQGASGNVTGVKPSPTSTPAPAPEASLWDKFTESLKKGWPWQTETWRPRYGTSPEGLIPAIETPKIPAGWGVDTGQMYGTYPESWPPELVAWREMDDWAKAAAQGVINPLPDIDVSKLSSAGQKQYEQARAVVEAMGIKETPTEVAGAFAPLKQSTANLPFIGDKTLDAGSAMNFAERHNYGAKIVDEAGKELSLADLTALLMKEPNKAIYFGYAVGEGEILTGESTVSRYLQTFPDWVGMEQGRESIKEAQDFQTKQAEILTGVTAENFDAKASELYYAGMKGAPITWSLGEAISLVFDKLSPEEQKVVSQRTETGKVPTERGEIMIKEGLDVQALGASLATHGISILSEYPYISPMTRAQLAKIPADILAQMEVYLSEKGISLGDVVTIGESYYGGGAGGGRWDIPQQWG